MELAGAQCGQDAILLRDYPQNELLDLGEAFFEVIGVAPSDQFLLYSPILKDERACAHGTFHKVTAAGLIARFAHDVPQNPSRVAKSAPKGALVVILIVYLPSG